MIEERRECSWWRGTGEMVKLVKGTGSRDSD